MKRTRTLLIAGAAALAIGVVAACGTAPNGYDTPSGDSNAGQQSSNLHERTITLKDGRTITCVIYEVNSAGGVSCDWEGARQS